MTASNTLGVSNSHLSGTIPLHYGIVRALEELSMEKNLIDIAYPM